ncbi:MAG: N-acetylmuramoyl-L-alanine amidase [Pseudomonadota bacterium]
MSHPRSPNFGERRHGAGRAPDMVVLHYTGMQTAEAAVARLCDPAFEVSAHYVIAEDGRVFDLVSEEKRAWHAGIGAWGDVRDVNSHSIGIELANPGPEGALGHFPEEQMRVLERILGELLARYSIPKERVVGHSDIAPGRKFDPGPLFDWQRLAKGGLSIWAHGKADCADWARFKTAALRFGYRPASETLAGWQEVLHSFRLRFRPEQTGDLDPYDLGTLETLARDYPCAFVD